MGFIGGKYYNSCTSIHDIITLSMERKLYESFLLTISSERPEEPDQLLEKIPEDLKSLDDFQHDNLTFQDHLHGCNTFFRDVLECSLGLTAHF